MKLVPYGCVSFRVDNGHLFTRTMNAGWKPGTARKKEAMAMSKKEKAKHSLPVRIIRGVILAVVLVAAVFMVLRLLEYKQGSDTYASLSAEMTTAAPSSESSQEDGKSEPPLLEIDFESLQAQNPEVVAWLEFPALGLSYPIMHTDNNDYYLHHLWNGQYNASGSLFLAAENESIDDLYTVVYGHNMADGSMFGLLNRYMEESFCKENGDYFRIYTPEAVWRYDIFTAAQVPKDDVVYTFGYTQGTIYDEFLQTLASYTLYDTGTEVQPGDTVMTLSTCTARDSVRRILCARRAEKLR